MDAKKKQTNEKKPKTNLTIEDKMDKVFNDALKNNEILTLNEKKVLAALMYSYKVSHESKDGVVAKGMRTLRAEIGTDMNSMYDAVRNLEFLYKMFDRVPGERRVEGMKAKASEFKLHFERILNPPIEEVKFDFSEELKSLETSINYPNTNTNTNTKANANTKANINAKANANLKADAKANTDANADAKTEANSKLKANSKVNVKANATVKADESSYIEEPLTTEDLDIDSIFIENKRRPKKGHTIKELEERMSWEQAFGNILQHQAKQVLSTVKPIE